MGSYGGGPSGRDWGPELLTALKSSVLLDEEELYCRSRSKLYIQITKRLYQPMQSEISSNLPCSKINKNINVTDYHQLTNKWKKILSSKKIEMSVPPIRKDRRTFSLFHGLIEVSWKIIISRIDSPSK